MMGSRVGFAPLFAVAWILLFGGDSFAKMQKGYVQKITDGDTIWFNTNKNFSVDSRLKIRMVHMDAPETHLPTNGNGIVNQGHWGDDATAYLSKLINVNMPVSLDNQGSDKYQRTLGVVFYKDRDVNLKMVESGWAIPYVICSGPTCNKQFFAKENIEAYLTACQEARAAGRGIWDPADPLEEMPFEFRLRQQERDADKWVGDYKTKVMVEPNEYATIDVCRRIFFLKKSEGTRAGFHESK